MFDLEEKISEWRKQMLAAGIQTPVPLEELEIHLREEIERQMKTGTNPQQAFESSVQQIGQAGELKGEFKKVSRTKYFSKLSRWSLFWTGVSGLVLTAISNLALPFVHGSAALVSLSHWTVWLPNCIMFTTVTVSGLVIGFARWHAKLTLLWISSIALIGTMMANLVCRFVLHESDSGFFSAGGPLIRWGLFYTIWMIFIIFSLGRPRFLGFFNRKLQFKTTRD
jgi:hypothetical protein